MGNIISTIQTLGSFACLLSGVLMVFFPDQIMRFFGAESVNRDDFRLLGFITLSFGVFALVFCVL